MKTTIPITTLIAALTAIATTASAQVPPIPETPAPIDEVVYAQRFSLAQGYQFNWHKERPQLTEGTILVLKVNPNLVFPRQSPEPVLYVGDTAAEEINVGYPSGHLIAVVPGSVDLANTLIWFGRPYLPERVDRARVQAERALAEAAGIAPPSAEPKVREAASGGDTLQLADRNGLRPIFAGLIQRYSPGEKDLIRRFNVPVMGQ